MSFSGGYGAHNYGLCVNTYMKPRGICPACNQRPVAINSIKKGVRYYRKMCDICIRVGKGLTPKPPAWQLAGYKKKPHPDNIDHDHFNLCVDGIKKLKKSFAPDMKHCYIWIDYGCIDQEKNSKKIMMADLQQLMNLLIC